MVAVTLPWVELEQQAAASVFSQWCEAFGVLPNFAFNDRHRPCVAAVGRFREGSNALQCVARLKFAPVYLIHWLSQQRTIWSLSLQDLVSVPFQRFHLPADTFLVDAEFLWSYFDDECCLSCHHLGHEAPFFRLSDDYRGRVPWRDAEESDWYRAMNDDTAGWAVPNYSIPAELRPH